MRAGGPSGDPGRGGFTLVELMITIAILGFLAWMAVTNFQAISEKYAVEGETKQLYADLMDARGRAMQRSRTFFVRLQTGGYSTYEDSSPAPDGNGTYDAGQDEVVTGVTVRHAIREALTGGANFSFDRNGIASDNGVIRFESDVNPDYDCITILATRTKMGQYNVSTGTCIEK